MGQIVLNDHLLSWLSWISYSSGLLSLLLILRVVVWDWRCIITLLHTLSGLLLLESLFIVDLRIILFSSHRVDILVDHVLLCHCDAIT